MTLCTGDARDKPEALPSQRHNNEKFKNQTSFFFLIYFNEKANSFLGQSAIMVTMERTSTDKVM